MRHFSFSRSEVNRLITAAAEIFAAQGFAMPPFARWEPSDWIQAGPEWDSAREARVGWDVTDFGLGNFRQVGRVLFTLRNGRPGGTDKPYAEKIILGRQGQRAPAHYHIKKIEDIINRGGGEVVLSLRPSSDDPELSKIYKDGEEYLLTSETKFRLQPGESLCIPPGIIHQFWGDETIPGQVPMIGEVSSFCDDIGDNVFLQEVARFVAIEEDEPARYCLCHELPASGVTVLEEPNLQTA